MYSLGGRFDGASVQLWWRFQTYSARSTSHGIQPMPPSEKATFNVGKRSKTPDRSQSANPYCALINETVKCTVAGASREVGGMCDELPMCIHSGIPASCTAANSGSQWRPASWMEG